MPRKSDRKPEVESPIRSRQHQLAQMEAQVKAKLSKTKEFLEKAPALKDEAQKKQQRAIVDRFNIRLVPVGYTVRQLIGSGTSPDRHR